MQRFRSLYHLLSVIICLIIWQGNLCGETNFGSIDATVTLGGRPFPDATVTATSNDTGLTRSCRTNTNGFCRLENLPIGSYKVEVDGGGLRWIEQHRQVDLAPPETPINARLSLDRETVTVTVSGEVPIIETTTTQLTGTITGSQIVDLPLSSRNFAQLTLITPGTYSPTGDALQSNASANFSVNGSRANSNNYEIDGIDANDPFSNAMSGMGTSISIPLESVEEIKVASNFDSGFGRNSGSIVNLVVKSGSNFVHGSIYEYLRHDLLSARNFFDSQEPKARLRYNNFGISLGGPIKKDKFFAFANYEGRRTTADATTMAAVPSDSEISDAIRKLGGDPSIPPEDNPVVNTIIRRLLLLCKSNRSCSGGRTLWPQPVSGRSGPFNAIAKSAGRGDSDSFVAKLDYLLDSRNQLAASYLLSKGMREFPLAMGGGDYLPNTNTRSSERVQSASVAYTWSSGNLSNELRVGWIGFSHRAFDADAQQVGNPTDSIGLDTGISSARDFGLPQLVVDGFSTLGSSPYSNPNGRDGNTLHLTESLTWIAGRHNLSAGYEIRRPSVSFFDDANFRGRLEFGSLSDFFAGRIRRSDISRGITDCHSSQTMQAIYFKDSFRLRRTLTIDFGIRWEYSGVLQITNNLFSRYDLTKGLITPPTFYNRDLDDFGPRLGVIWDITGAAKSVLRAGAGIFYDVPPQQFFVGQVQFNTFTPGPLYNPSGSRPILSSHSANTILVDGSVLFPEATFLIDSRDVWTTPSDLITPYVANYNFNFQQQVFQRVSVQVGYVGSQGHKLFRVRDINAPVVPGGGRPFDSAAALTQAGPKPFVVNQIETTASSNYHSLQAVFRLADWHGMTGQASWTWAHAIDDASDGIDVFPNASLPNDSHAPRRERANSSFDTRHKIGVNVLYRLPRVHIIGKGWQVGGLLSLTSGQPYNVNFGREFDSVGAYDFLLRPDFAGNPSFATANPFRSLNLAALRVPCTFNGLGPDVTNCVPGTLHFGNVPRNAFRGPDLKDLDLTISKTITLSDKISLQLRADIFNLANHPNFASPLLPRFIADAGFSGIDLAGRGGAVGTGCNTTLASNGCYLPLMGTVDASSGNPFLSIGGPRLLQVSAKILF